MFGREKKCLEGEKAVLELIPTSISCTIRQEKKTGNKKGQLSFQVDVRRLVMQFHLSGIFLIYGVHFYLLVSIRLISMLRETRKCVHSLPPD